MLAGIWNLDGRPLARSLIDRVLYPLTPGASGRALWREGSVALAAVPPGGLTSAHRPLLEDSGTCVVFDGRLDDRHGLVEALAPLPEADELMTDAALVLAAYQTWGDDLGEHLVGDYALAIFDPRKQWLLLARDHAGTRPLHFLRLPDTMVVSSRIDSLLAHPGSRRRPNEPHLSRAVLGGAPQWDSAATTPFDQIHSVAPGHVAILTRGRFATRRFADPLLSTWDQASQEVPPPDRDLAHVLDRAVDRRARATTVVVDLSQWGSESLLGAALRCPDVRPLAIVPPGRSAPVAAEALSMASPTGSAADLAVDVVRLVESPSLDPWDLVRCDALRDAAGAGAVVWLSARGAYPLLSDDGYLAELIRHGAVREALEEVPPGSFPRRARTVGRAAARGLVPDQLQRPARAVRAYIGGPLRDADWYTNAFRLWATKASTAQHPPEAPHDRAARGVYEQARSAGLVADLERDAKIGGAAGLEVAFPFLDPDVVGLLMRVPGSERVRAGDPAAMLPVPPGRPVPDAAGRLLLDGWEECRRRFLRVAVAAEEGYVDGPLLGSELDFLHDDLAAGDAAVAGRLMDLLGLEVFLEGLTPE